MLIELEGALGAAGVRHAIVGGIAMAAHGRIRATEDIDLLVDAVQESQLETALGVLGYRGAQAGIATRYVRQPLSDLTGLQEWIDVLASYPALVQRPLVVAGDGTAYIARDSAAVETVVEHSRRNR